MLIRSRSGLVISERLQAENQTTSLLHINFLFDPFTIFFLCNYRFVVILGEWTTRSQKKILNKSIGPVVFVCFFFFKLKVIIGRVQATNMASKGLLLKTIRWFKVWNMWHTMYILFWRFNFLVLVQISKFNLVNAYWA